MGRPLVVWSPDLLAYEFAPSHPFDPRRWGLTMDVVERLGLAPLLEFALPDPAPDSDLELIHTRDYLTAVRRAAAGELGVGHGLGTEDNPAFADMDRAAALIAGGSIHAARAIADGRATRAVNIAGGHHHALAHRASGFCVYNDVSLAIAALLQAGVERVAYVDIDVHHGDGVQRAFENDARVLTVSVHQDPFSMWPGTGLPTEVGHGDAAGSAVNLAVPAGTDDAGWLRAFRAVVPSVLRAFGPQVLVTQHGADGHREDPMSDLRLTVDGLVGAQRELRGLAAELCQGRWLALGGGGYVPVRVVPRVWAQLVATVADVDLPADTPMPPRWAEDVARRYGGIRVDLPGTLGDTDVPPPLPAWNGLGATPLDRAVLATRSAVFPLWGLDPRDPRD